MIVSLYAFVLIDVSEQAYGAAGVVKIVRILEHEIMTGMRLLGAKTVHDLVPEMVCHNSPCHILSPHDHYRLRD